MLLDSNIIIIASKLAQIYDLTLFTENVKDYAGIKDLKVVSIKDILNK